MKDHNVAAGVFLLMFVGGVGTLITYKTMQQHDRAGKEEREEVREVLRTAVEQGQRGRFKEAISVLQEATGPYGRYSAIWLNLGIAQRATGDLESAAHSFEEALKANPNDWDAIAERATVQKLRGSEADALASLERIPPGHGRVRERLEVDPAWGEAKDAERLEALRQKHQSADPTQASFRQLLNMEERRRQFQRTNGSEDSEHSVDTNDPK